MFNILAIYLNSYLHYKLKIDVIFKCILKLYFHFNTVFGKTRTFGVFLLLWFPHNVNGTILFASDVFSVLWHFACSMPRLRTSTDSKCRFSCTTQQGLGLGRYSHYRYTIVTEINRYTYRHGHQALPIHLEVLFNTWLSYN